MGLSNFLVARVKRLGISKQLLKIYIAAFLSIFASAFSITMMFPFLPFMVEFLLPDIDEESVGKFVGYIASSMFFGRVIGSYVWGAVADHKGRKPVFVVSSLLVGLTSAAFGFSVNFAMAVLLRFLVGLTNGVVGTAKAVISEASDDRNQAFGISVVASAWGLGFVVGPAVSGALADPVGQYNLNISNAALHSFLTRFPYSPPCLVNFMLCIIAAVVTIFLLPETRGLKKNRKRSELTKLEDFQKQHSKDSGNPQHSETSSLASNTSTTNDEARLLDPETDSIDGRSNFTSGISLQSLDGASSENPLTGSRQSLNSTSQSWDQTEFGSETETRKKAHNSTSDGSETRRRMDSTSDVRNCSASNSSTTGAIACTSNSSTGLAQVDRRIASRGAADIKEFTGPDQDYSHGCVIVNSGFASFTSLENDCYDERESEADAQLCSHGNSITPPASSQEHDTITENQDDVDISGSSNDHNESDSIESNAPLIEEEEERVGDGSLEEVALETSENCDQDSEENLTVRRSWASRIGQSFKKSLLDLKSFLCDRVTLLALLVYSIFSFAVIGFDETYNLWAYTQPYLGGLGFSLHEIGISLSVVGAFLLPFSLCLYVVMEKYLGSIKTFCINCTTLMFFVVLLPNIHYLIPTGLDGLLWFLLCAVALIMRVAIVTCFSASIVLINNSVTFDQLGAVNGLAVAMTALFRTVAPVFSGGIYSLSLSPAARALGFPFDYNVIFVAFALVWLLSIAMVTCLPESVNKQKIIEDE